MSASVKEEVTEQWGVYNCVLRGTATDNWLDGRGTEARFQVEEKKIVLFSTVSIQAVGPTQSPIQWL